MLTLLRTSDLGIEGRARTHVRCATAVANDRLQRKIVQTASKSQLGQVGHA